MSVRPADPNVVLERVCDWYHVSVQDVQDCLRVPIVVRARRVALVLIREMSQRTWRESMRFVGLTSTTVGDGWKAARLADPVEVAEVRKYVEAA